MAKRVSRRRTGRRTYRRKTGRRTYRRKTSRRTSRRTRRRATRRYSKQAGGMLPYFRHEGELYASRNNLFGGHPGESKEPPVYVDSFRSDGVIKCLTANGITDQLSKRSEGKSKSDVFIDNANLLTFVSANYVKITKYYTPSSGIDTTATRHHIQKNDKDMDMEIILHPGTLFMQQATPHTENPADYKDIPYTYVRKSDLAGYQAYISRAASAHNMGHSTTERGSTETRPGTRPGKRTIRVTSGPQPQPQGTRPAGVVSSQGRRSGGSSPERSGRSPSPDAQRHNQSLGDALSGLASGIARKFRLGRRD